MSAANIVEQTKKRLADGQTEAAIDFLKPFLEAEKSHSQLLRALRLTESNLRQAQEKALQNLLTDDEARKAEATATASVLAILEHLEGGAKLPPTQAQKMRRGLWILVGLAAVAAAAVFVILPLFRLDCPVFSDKTALKVLILPFQNGGEKGATPEEIMATDIENLTKKAGIRAEARIKKGYQTDAETLGFSKLKIQAEHCGADLVIAGQLVERDSMRLRLFFQFRNAADGQMTGFEAMPDPSFWQKGELKTAMSDALLSVCAAIAVRENKLETAEKWLQKTAQKGVFETRGLAELAAKKDATH